MGNATSLMTRSRVEDQLHSQFRTEYLAQFDTLLPSNETPLIKFLETISHDHFEYTICKLAKYDFSPEGTYTFPGDDRHDSDSLKVPVTKIDVMYIVEKCGWAIVLRNASVVYVQRVIGLIGDQGERSGLEAISRE